MKYTIIIVHLLVFLTGCGVDSENRKKTSASLQSAATVPRAAKILSHKIVTAEITELEKDGINKYVFIKLNRPIPHGTYPFKIDIKTKDDKAVILDSFHVFQPMWSSETTDTIKISVHHGLGRFSTKDERNIRNNSVKKGNIESMSIKIAEVPWSASTNAFADYAIIAEGIFNDL